MALKAQETVNFPSLPFSAAPDLSPTPYLAPVHATPFAPAPAPVSAPIPVNDPITASAPGKLEFSGQRGYKIRSMEL